MRLKAIRFQNYRAFQAAELPLDSLTLLIGPNSSGKTSALSAIQVMSKVARSEAVPSSTSLIPVGLAPTAMPRLEAIWDGGVPTRFIWQSNRAAEFDAKGDALAADHLARIRSGRLYALDPSQIGAPVTLTKTLELQENGAGLPAVLTTLQDQWPERFEGLNRDLRRWLPEFDRVLLDTPQDGRRAVLLRTVQGGHKVPADKLSAGTLLSLTLLSICHLPIPPAIVGLEEPDHGIHPRLLRDVKDSLLRLTSPKSFGDERDPVQVVVSTHSPYFVDLFRDELESIVITQKEGLYSTFKRLVDLPHVEDIVKDAALGAAWYSGILGGVPEPVPA